MLDYIIRDNTLLTWIGHAPRIRIIHSLIRVITNTEIYGNHPEVCGRVREAAVVTLPPSLRHSGPTITVLRCFRRLPPAGFDAHREFSEYVGYFIDSVSYVLRL